MRSFVVLAVLFSASAVSQGAAAAPTPRANLNDHPLHQLAARERPDRHLHELPTRAIVPRGAPLIHPAPLVTPATMDCEHAAHDITLDATTGVTTAILDLTVRSHGTLQAIGLSLDDGLSIGNVTASGRAVSVDSEVYAPIRVAHLQLVPPLSAGETTTIHVEYNGTLRCNAFGSGASLCRKGVSFSYFAQQSIVPFIFDPARPTDSQLDAMTREVVMRVPATDDVVVSGEKISDTIAGPTKISRWQIAQPLSRMLGFYIFAGQLGMRAIEGRPVPTTLFFPAPEQAVDGRLASWSPPALDFVEQFAAHPLPFAKSQSLVRLPRDLGDPGTATFGMTLLSEKYADAGDLMHEETWAHENAHLFWGVTVPERDARESRLLSEGLAVLTELEYTYARHFKSMDRDAYFARRFVPIGLDLASVEKQLPPVLLGAAQTPPDDPRKPLYTLWAYYKTAAALDHLRVTVGEDVFGKGLTEYVARCMYVGCSPDDFRQAIEFVSKKDLQPFFRRWIAGSDRPEVRIAFAPIPGGAEVDLTKDDDDPMTLELWVRAEDGTLAKQRIDLTGRETRIRVDAASGVRSVMASPRHDLLVKSRSVVDGDLDFDGESDGFDILRCTRIAGRSYTPLAGTGLWLVDESFDPRCDLNGDETIDDTDFQLLAASFGNLRAQR